MSEHPELSALASDPMYLTDPGYYAEVERLRGLLRRLGEAMADEGISHPIQERIINRLLYGHPDGARARAERIEAEQALQTWTMQPATWQQLLDPKE